MVDPLRDPDDPELLDPYRARALASLIETTRLASGAVRYGKIGRVGSAQVVVNRDNPLPSGNFACGLDGSSVEVAGTLLRLEQTFADVGRAEAVVYASPTTVDEIEGIADDSGWYAVEELVAVVHRGSVAETSVRRAVDADLPGITELLSDELIGARERLIKYLGHRLDDPRCVLLVVDDGARLAGFVGGFAEHGVGLVEQVIVRPARRRRGVGRSLVHGAVAALRSAGALLVASQVDEGGSGERFAEACGFVAAYPVTAYVRRVDELLD
ncbi:GNAT family N-acetyltransferase [Lentzea tibetensis]|uniref:GNAT family N-acetyltransferase n=1 Tax=Lentzea tibetensis TaxID=2591470 RepID=A0A563EMW2_9PSEU|nr:GNAT family N-acetyltransferase [Lentzea tibetensis]TWP47954.1 GNAT family N-acetyltransferase [Lentzea tibetensis]